MVSLWYKDELLLTLSLTWSESDQPQRQKDDLQQGLQTWFNKQKPGVVCSVERTSGDRAAIKLKPLPALSDLQKLTGETVTTKGGKAVIITSVSLDSQTPGHVSGNSVLLCDDISPRKRSQPFSAASASNAPLDNDEGVSADSCLVSVDHFCYMNHIYKKEIRQIEKKNKSNMVAYVNVTFEADQTDGRPNEALSDFTKLIQNHSAESRGSVVPLKFVDPDQWSEAMKVIQKSHKLFFTLCSEEVVVRGPSQSREVFSGTLNAAQKTNMPFKESQPAAENTSQRADKSDLDVKESSTKESKVNVYKAPTLLHQTSSPLTSTHLYGATGFSGSLKNMTSDFQIKDPNIRPSSSLKITQNSDAPKARNSLSSEEVVVRGPSQSQETFSGTLNAAQRTNVPSKKSQPASENTSQRADMSTREPLCRAELPKEGNSKTAAKTKARTDLDDKESSAKKSKVDASYKTQSGNFSLTAPTLLHQTSSPSTSTQPYGTTGFSGSLKNLTNDFQIKDTNIRASSSIETTKNSDTPKEVMVRGPSQSQETFSWTLNADQKRNVSSKESQPASQTTSQRADMSIRDCLFTLLQQTSSPSTSTQPYGATGFSGSQHKDLNTKPLSKQTTTTNSDASKPGNSKDEICPICLDSLINKKQLKCKHQFCKECLHKTIKQNGPTCPVCKDVFGVMEGNQPDGTMTWFKYLTPLPGFSDCGHLLVFYNIRGGIQTEKHPNPGQPYHGTVRVAYLPDNKEGNEVLELLKRAFDQKLIFTVGTSRTSGKDNMVIWNDIPHKTVKTRGAEGFGYPDPGYLSRVKEDLKAKGIQ